MTRPLVLCLINEAWFFRSHFMRWGEAAREAGFDVSVVATPGEDAGAFAAAGIRLVPSRAVRGGVLPKGLMAAARQVGGQTEPGRPTIVHAFGMHGMAIAALARWRRRPDATVVSVTGLGLLAAEKSTGRFAARMLAGQLDGAQTRWLVENPSDPSALGLVRAASEGRIVPLLGAGVDLERFRPSPFPASPPLRLILVARLIRSKGVDIAVEGLAMARRRGVNATLTIVGAPDPANPRAYSARDLAAFAAIDGATLAGARTDIAELLGAHHAFILPSRGGEGLPKALLEAAAAGRPAIVSDVPGCRDFVVDGQTGWICRPDDAASVADAIERAATTDIAAFGAAARHRVEASGSIGMVASQVVETYRDALRGAGQA